MIRLCHSYSEQIKFLKNDEKLKAIHLNLTEARFENMSLWSMICLCHSYSDYLNKQKKMLEIYAQSTNALKEQLEEFKLIFFIFFKLQLVFLHVQDNVDVLMVIFLKEKNWNFTCVK